MTTNQPAPVEPATITPAPFTEQQLCNAWNSQADHANDWDSLDIFEQLAWAQARAIAADRAGRPTPPAEGEAGELVVWLRSLIGKSVWFESGSENASKLVRAAYFLLAQPHQIAELQRQLDRRSRPHA